MSERGRDRRRAEDRVQSRETTFEPSAVERVCTAFVREVVDDAGAEGVVVALRGGLGSTTAATLAVDALGPDHVYGLVLPADAGAESATADARDVASDLGIDHRAVDLRPVLDRFTDAMTKEKRVRTSDPLSSRTRVTVADPVANRDGYADAARSAAARVRVAATCFEASTRSRLVLGTDNRTERLLGRVAEHGGGGVDLQPLGDLYVTEVRALARHLGVPGRIVETPPTAGPRDGRAAEDALGASDETIDAVLRRLVDGDDGVEPTAASLDLDVEFVARIAEMLEAAARVRARPPPPSAFDRSG